MMPRPITFLSTNLLSSSNLKHQEREGRGEMGTMINVFSLPLPLKFVRERRWIGNLEARTKHHGKKVSYCKITESETVEENRSGAAMSRSSDRVEENPSWAGMSRSSDRVEDYNTAMKRMMRNPYEYHHDLGMNYAIITDSLIVGSQPQKPEDIDHLKVEQNVAYILCLQQDTDIEYWGIDFHAIVERCKELGIRHMRRPARDFDPDSLRGQLPKAVSSLEWAVSEGKGRVYVHCTAGLGRAPAVAIAYMFWFCNMDLNTAYKALTSKRPCGPNKQAIRGATYDLAKTDSWKEPFENLPEHAFSGLAGWERELIRDRVRGLRGT